MPIIRSNKRLLPAAGSAAQVLTKNSGSNFDAAWAAAPDNWTRVWAAANQDVTNSTTLVDSTYLQLALTSGVLYRIRVWALFDTTANADVKWTYTGPACTIVRHIRANGATAITAPVWVAPNSGNTWPSAVGFSLTGTGTEGAWVWLELLVQPSANGTFAFRFAQNTADNTGPCRLLKGSYLEYAVVP